MRECYDHRFLCIEIKGCLICFWYILGKLQKRKWENAMTIDSQSWGYRRNANIGDYLSIEQLITTIVETVR